MPPRPRRFSGPARLGVGVVTVQQVARILEHEGLLLARRGPGGGYRLARSSDAMTIADIVAAVDAPIGATRCRGSEPGCQTHDLWEELDRQIQMFLEGVTLADVVAGRVQRRAAPLDDGRRLAAE